MLEQYFIKPSTIDRIRGSWIAVEIETYVGWLVDQGYGAKTIWRRVPIAFAFGEFARKRGALAVGDLPAMSGLSSPTASLSTKHAPVRRGRWQRRSVARSSRCSPSYSPASSHPAGLATPSPSPLHCQASSAT
jgi:hypothetical protein